MKDIFLVTNYWHFECEKASSRYRTLADMIVESEMQLEIVTSSFYHMHKKQREFSGKFLESFPYQVKLIYEPGYKKNISFQRLRSHYIFAKNVIEYLKKRKKPDIIFCVVPSLEVADRVTKYANENHIPVILDIQDLWPEAFKMAINIPVISDFIFRPMMRQANKIYERADKIVAVSDTYRDRGLAVNNKDKEGLSVYIGSDFQLIENYSLGNISHPDEFWITYIGALGHSYNIPLVIDALEILQLRGINNIVFKIMGTGVKEEYFQKYAREKKIRADFLGQMEYVKMMDVLMSSDVAVNPIISVSASTIINKVSDYAIAGVPVINTQNSREYRILLEKYKAGINCSPTEAIDVANAIERIYKNPKLRNEMKSNAKKLGMDKFDRRITYREIIKILQGI